MKNKTLLIALISVLLSVACNQGPRDYKLNIHLQKLSEATIYDTRVVKDVCFDAEGMDLDSLKNKSRELFLKGIDQYRNKKNPVGAIRLFKESILILSDAKTYYELGNALADLYTKNYLEEALDAYRVADELEFQPISSVYVKEAAVYYQQYRNKPDNEYTKNDAINCLYRAFTNGYKDTLALINTPALKGITLLPEYHNMLTNITIDHHSGEEDVLFDLFRNAFPQQSNQLVIDKEGVEMGDYRESINYEFARFIPEMENTSFGRDVSHDFYYVSKLKQTAIYTAVVYASINFSGDDMQPVHTTLAVYDNTTGELISRKPIACQCSAERIRSSIVSNGEIIIEDYERKWEKPITEVAFEDNKVSAYTLLSKASFSIDDNGKIIPKDVPAGYSDSLVTASN